MSEEVRNALCRAADALCRFDQASIQQAEAALHQAVICARELTFPGGVVPSDWPSAELAICSQLALNQSLFWERRRAASKTLAMDAAPASWMA